MFRVIICASAEPTVMGMVEVSLDIVVIVVNKFSPIPTVEVFVDEFASVNQVVSPGQRSPVPIVLKPFDVIGC